MGIKLKARRWRDPGLRLLQAGQLLTYVYLVWFGASHLWAAVVIAGTEVCEALQAWWHLLSID